MSLMSASNRKSNVNYSLREDSLRIVSLPEIGSINIELIELVDDLRLGIVAAYLHLVVAEHVNEQVLAPHSSLLCVVVRKCGKSTIFLGNELIADENYST